MLNLKGHEENGVVILDEPQRVYLYDLKLEYCGGACLIDIDGKLEQGCIVKIYACCDKDNIDNIKLFKNKTPNKYALLLIGGIYTR